MRELLEIERTSPHYYLHDRHRRDGTDLEDI